MTLILNYLTGLHSVRLFHIPSLTPHDSVRLADSGSIQQPIHSCFQCPRLCHKKGARGIPHMIQEGLQLHLALGDV
jgi:hypothetical protein